MESSGLQSPEFHFFFLLLLYYFRCCFVSFSAADFEDLWCAREGLRSELKGVRDGASWQGGDF